MSGPPELAARILAGDVRAGALLMRDLDDRIPGAIETLKKLYPSTGRAFVLGITGHPGAGKSTVVDVLIERYRAQGKRVGVVAVDPTSPFSGGAILGDRIRMQRHATDAGVFIRSLATRGHLGGLSRSTADVALVLDAMGYGIVIIETVGVGQDEVEVVAHADTTVVVTVPGLGDEIQAIKAGILEIADVLLVNKADREGADRSVRHLIAMLELRPHDAATVEIVKTIGSTGEGVDDLMAAIERHSARERSDGIAAPRLAERKRRRAEAMLDAVMSDRLRRVAAEARAARPDILARVASRELDPYTAADLLLPPAGIAAVRPAALAAALWGLALADGVARADEKEWVITAQPGFAVLGVNGRSVWGGGGGIDLGYGVADGLALRVTGSLSAHPVAADPAPGPAQPGGTALAYHAGVGLSYAIDIVRVVPALDFSIGLLGARTPTASGDATDAQLGIELGLSIDYLVSRRVSIGVYARYHAALTVAAHLPLYLYAGPRVSLHFGG